MRAWVASVTAGAVLSSCVASRPSRLPSSVDLRHRQGKLANGMAVVTHRDASVPVVSVALAVATGAADDPVGREGLAHAVEHLAFRAHHGGPAPFRLALDRIGARFNAWTSPEATVYHATAPTASLGALGDAFAALARDPLEGVVEAALEVERGVLENERRFRNENGAPGAVGDRLRGLLFGKGPLGRPVAGTAESLRQITLGDAKAFARAHYRPAAMTLALSGALGDEARLLAPFAAIPGADRRAPARPPPDRAVPRDPGIVRVPAAVPTPELWIGFRLPGAYGPERARMDVMADMASGGVAGRAWARHGDVTLAHCFLEPGLAASVLVCRAWLSSIDDVDSVRRSLVQMARKGIADAAVSQSWRYLYTRLMATEELLAHESLGFRTHALVTGAHFARDPGFDLKQVSALEALESGDILGFYDPVITLEASRAVLALPATSAELGAVPLAPAAPVEEGAPLGDSAGMFTQTRAELREASLSNGLRVIAVRRAEARFQTVLLGFFDGVARNPPAVVEAMKWAYVSYLVDPPRGVLQDLRYQDDSVVRVVRGPAGDPHVPLKRLIDGLSSYGINWKSEGYLDYAAGQKKREQDPRVRAPRLFRQALLFEHPYGRATWSADVDAVTIPQLYAFHDALNRPDNGVLIMVGGAATGEMIRAAEEELGSWHSRSKRAPKVRAREPVRPRGREGSRLMAVDQRSESQVTLTVGCVLPPSSLAMLATEDVLAHAIDGQLDEILRQRTGASYGVSVSLDRLRGGTTSLQVTSAVANEHLAPSLETLYRWFVEPGEPLTAGSVEVARFGALVSHALAVETSHDLARLLFDYARLGLSSKDLAEHAGRLRDVDPARVNALLSVCRDTSLVLAVGDERKVREAWR